jgi:two-component system sensor histidine kinase QseC
MLNLTKRIMIQTKSIKRFLMLFISVLLCFYLAFAYLLSKNQAAHEIDELFDPQLTHSASVLQDILGTLIENTDQNTTVLPIVYESKNLNSEPVMTVEPSLFETEEFIYKNKFAYQLFNEQGQLLVKTDNAPNIAYANQKQGFSRKMINNESWRIYSVYDPQRALWLYVAESEIVRGHLSIEIAQKIVLPALVIFPLFLILLMINIHLGLSPLQALVSSLNQRKAISLSPIKLEVVPREIQPIIDAINSLISRVDETLTREKRLTADTAHELRTPLAIVLVHAQNALKSQNKEERDESLIELESGIKRLSRLLDQLLTLAKITPETIDKSPLVLHTLCQNVMADIAITMIDKQQEPSLFCDIALQTSQIVGSDFLLKILVRNLLSNASQYGSEQGEIHLTIKQENKNLILSVEDAGKGVDPKHYNRLTDRFYRQCQQKGEGAGLGLSLVKKIAEFHQAKLIFSASELGGLKVSIYFPVSKKNI